MLKILNQINIIMEDKIEISKTKFITVSEYRGKQYINLREYYLNDDGELKPGKKGISLTVEQWNKLTEQADAVELLIKN